MRNTLVEAGAILLFGIALMSCLTSRAVEVDPVILNAIICVESSHNARAVGDNGKAVGLLQLHKIYVDDVNRIVGKKKYSYADRWNPQKSVEMTVIYLRHYGERYERLTEREATYEILARIHNGGPDGWEKPSTNKYWKKISQHL
jgi:soluble lytic murein transglycosylase-like protein